jgi:hypothetical protein
VIRLPRRGACIFSVWVAIEVNTSLSPALMLPTGIFFRMWRTREPAMMAFSFRSEVVLDVSGVWCCAIWWSIELIGCTGLVETVVIDEEVVC